MGNWFGRSNLTVKLNDVGMKKNQEDEDERRKSFDAGSSPRRIKVVMTRRQLEELKKQADKTSRGNSELGRLIVKECLDARLSPRVVFGQCHVLENSRSRRLSLSTIDEEAIGK